MGTRPAVFFGQEAQFTSYDGAGNLLSRTDGNYVVRRDAAIVCGERRFPGAARRLEFALEHETDPIARIGILAGLCCIGARGAWLQLREYYVHKDLTVRRNAYNMLDPNRVAPEDRADVTAEMMAARLREVDLGNGAAEDLLDQLEQLEQLSMADSP